MRPVPIPDARIWDGALRQVIAGPGGDLTSDIRPVEALIDSYPDMGPRFNILIRLDDGDLERLAADPTFWLSWFGDHLHVFALTLDDTGDSKPPPARRLIDKLSRYDCRDSDGCCLACNEWSEHANDCAFIVAGGTDASIT